jgi:preprotein translocase subunit SecG
MVYLILVIAILLILVVLVQNSKGGGLVNNAGANQIMGVRKTADFLEKATWTLAGLVIFLSLITGMMANKRSDEIRKARTDEEAATTTENVDINPNYINQGGPGPVQNQQTDQ